MAIVIVAIPDAQDRVHKVSSEKVPHLTMMYLGDDVPADQLQRIVLFVEHVANTVLERFGLTVDHRGELGDKKADVLFFEKKYYAQELKNVLGNLLTNRDIYEVFHSATQFPEWIPHLTLGFPETPANEIEDGYGLSYVAFDRIAVWTGDYDGPEFRLKENDHAMEAAWSATRDAGVAAIDRALAAMEVVDEDADALQFGVKGMKWGVKKADVRTSKMIVSDGKAPKVGQVQPVQLVAGGKIEGRIVTKVTEISIPQQYKAQVPPTAKAYEIEHRVMTEEELQQPLSSFEHSMPEGEYLAHFGVKGMRWGVRRSKAELSADKNPDADPDAVRAVQTQAKIASAGTLNVVSSKDLQQLVDRIKLEQKYIDTTLAGSPTTKKGNSILKKILKNEIDYKLNKQDGPILSAFKAAKAAREKKVGEAVKAAAKSAKAAKDAADKAKADRDTQKSRERMAAAYGKHPGPFSATNPGATGNPAQRRTNYADRVYNVTTLNSAGNPLALPPRKKP